MTAAQPAQQQKMTTLTMIPIVWAETLDEQLEHDFWLQLQLVHSSGQQPVLHGAQRW